MLYSTLLLACSLCLATPYQNGVIGVSIDLPEGSTVVSTNHAPPFCLIAGDNSSNNWHLRFDRGPLAAGQTPEDIVRAARNTRADPPGTTVLEDRAITIGQLEGWWLLLKHPNASSDAVIGRLAIPAHGQQFIMASLLTNEEGWALHSASLLHALQTMQPLDPVNLITEKMEGLDAATSLLDELSEESLRPLVGFREWRRIQTKTALGSTQDIGYAYVTMEAGNVQEIMEGDQPADLEPTGIIVTLQSRLVPNFETGMIVDTNARFWMSWDGKEERWSNRVNQHMDRVRVIKSETGIRNRAQLGSPRAKLLVLQQDLTASTIETPFETVIEDPWLPRTMVWVIGRFVATDGAPSQFIWRTYDNNGVARVVTRTDTITLNSDGSKTITTRFGEDGEAVSTTVDGEGKLLHQTQHGGVFVTGSTEETLREIWQPQNLW